MVVKHFTRKEKVFYVSFSVTIPMSSREKKSSYIECEIEPSDSEKEEVRDSHTAKNAVKMIEAVRSYIKEIDPKIDAK